MNRQSSTREEERNSRAAAAERVFGVKFTEFRPLDAGNSSANYKAVAEDGSAYFVKFAKPARLDLVLCRARAVTSPLVPALAFGGRAGDCGAMRCCALEWLARGASVDPAALTPAQCASLVASYGALSDAMQGAAADLERPSDLEGVDFGEPLRAIHGDMHFRNVFFDGDEAVAFFDLEKMRIGHPAEDLLRMFVHALERTRFWRRARVAAIRRAFRETVRLSRYPARAWIAAIDLYERRKAAHRARKSSFPLVKRIEAALRAPLYRALRADAARSGGGDFF